MGGVGRTEKKQASEKRKEPSRAQSGENAPNPDLKFQKILEIPQPENPTLKTQKIPETT